MSTSGVAWNLPRPTACMTDCTMAYQVSMLSARVQRKRIRKDVFEFQWKHWGSEVHVCGSFNDWKTRIPLTKRSYDLFTATVNIPEGQHEYKFIVDGQWEHDPDQATVKNVFGTYNNIVDVSTSNTMHRVESKEDAVCESYLVEAVDFGYTSQDFLEALHKANQQMDIYKDPQLRCTLFYKCQSLQVLGKESDRVSVPIYIDQSVHENWYPHLDKAIEVINQAAPGLNLYKVDDKASAKVQIYGTSENSAYTIGNILSDPYHAEIHLYHEWWNMKRSSVHELFHALGFEHEQQRWDEHLSVVIKTSDPQYKPDPHVLGITRFDPWSIMLYCESSDLVRNPEGDTAWKLKPSKDINDEMSEVDKVGLNLIYRPCKGPDYNPHKNSDTGMWYCGRKVMDRHNHPAAGITYSCGPKVSANCPACRTLVNDKVQGLWGDGKWQGWSGLVYCGKSFREADSFRDGCCGPNNGAPCPECKKILLVP